MAYGHYDKKYDIETNTEKSVKFFKNFNSVYILLPVDIDKKRFIIYTHKQRVTSLFHQPAASVNN